MGQVGSKQFRVRDANVMACHVRFMGANFALRKKNSNKSLCQSTRSSPDHFDHLLAAAFLAISARRSGVIFSARALPPRLPIDTAAGSLPSASGVGMSSSISPVAMRATFTARAMASAGRFWPLGPVGIMQTNACWQRPRFLEYDATFRQLQRQLPETREILIPFSRNTLKA